MKRETILRLLTAGVSACVVNAVGASATAQSFDCGKAMTAVEKMICADADLSKLDTDMAQAFKAARRTLDVAAIGQVAWLKDVRNRCATAGCLRDAYRKRIADLGSLNSPWSTEGLAGEWTRLGDAPYAGASLSILSVTATGFAFELAASSGAHSGLIEGTAVKSAAGAAFIDDQTKCEVRFRRVGDRLVVSTSPKCASMGGMGVTFDGEFATGDAKSRTVTLTELGVLTRNVSEKDFAALVGEAYDAFTSSFQMVYEQKDVDGLGARVSSGAVQGLFTIAEAIVMSRPDGTIYAAVIDDGVVKYFSSDPGFKNKLPKTIEAWRERFAELKVVFASVTR